MNIYSSMKWFLVASTLSAGSAFAVDCAAKAAKAIQNCPQACAQMKKQSPEIDKAMKASNIKDCEAMCKMAQDSAKASCLQKEARRKH